MSKGTDQGQGQDRVCGGRVQGPLPLPLSTPSWSIPLDSAPFSLEGDRDQDRDKDRNILTRPTRSISVIINIQFASKCQNIVVFEIKCQYQMMSCHAHHAGVRTKHHCLFVNNRNIFALHSQLSLFSRLTSTVQHTLHIQDCTHLIAMQCNSLLVQLLYLSLED